LKAALKRDRTKTTVLGMTSLGLIEMTRKKVRQELDSMIHIDCPYCNGSGKILSPESVARNVERKLHQYFTETIATAVEISVHPTVAEIFSMEDNDVVERLERDYSKKIFIKASNAVRNEEIKIREVDSNNLIC